MAQDLFPTWGTWPRVTICYYYVEACLPQEAAISALPARIANDLAVAVAVLELVEQHPDLPDDLRAMVQTASRRLLEAAESLSDLAALPPRRAPEDA